LRDIAIFGYSGHAYIAIDILNTQGRIVTHYCTKNEFRNNPYSLNYLGFEDDLNILNSIKESFDFFIAIGSNVNRQKVFNIVVDFIKTKPVNAVHKNSIVSGKSSLGNGILIGAGVVINTLATIYDGVICNTACIIEHECLIGSFAHIGPGAVLAGGVQIGKRTFVGSNAVIKQGVKIGNDVTVGAGTVVLFDVPDNVTIVGNPGRILKK
jgi:sugar O-acyltransferase (sialic acid O-acetyltransferase NeuD family)